jgi:hypothetical protein
MKKDQDKNQEGIDIVEPFEKSNQTIEPLNDSQSVKINSEGVDVKRGGNFVIGSLNLMMDRERKKRKDYYKDNLWHLIADIFLLLIIVSLVFFLIFSLNINRNEVVSLQTEVDQQNITAGQLKTFELDYKVNKDIKESEVNVVFPENFIIESISPANNFNEEKNSFYLGDLSSGLNSKIKINGYVIGVKDDTQMISFTFNCDKCGRDGLLSSLFYSINKNLVNFDLKLPEKIYSGSEFESLIKINNNASRPISNIVIDLGEDLKINSSDQKIENNQILIESLAGKESLDVSFFATTKEKNLELTPSMNYLFIDKKYNTQGVKKSIVSKEASLDIKTSSDDSVIYKNKEALLYKINYQNRGSDTIKNVKIDLSSANDGFIIKSIDGSSANNNIYIEDKTIEIEDLIAGESGEIALEIEYDQRNIIPNQEVQLKTEVEYQINGQKVRYTNYSNKNKVSSETSVSLSAYYYSPQGDQLGVGPLPPAVDMATNYWLFLEFNNSGNDIENFVLTAELPENVYFSNNKRVLDGRLNYAEIGKRLTWEISDISGGVNKYKANIEVSLIPEESDLNTIPNLVENISYSFTDSFTNEKVSGNLENIDTDLKNDKLSSGKGKVTTIR